MSAAPSSGAWVLLRVAAVLICVASVPARAEIIYMTGRSGGGPGVATNLFSFDSATPGVVTNHGVITGLGAFQYVEDIDFRPATGELYALGYTGSVYKVDLVTLVATSQGFPGAPGTGYSHAGIDFNPVTDVLRLVDGQSGFNANFNPNTNTGGVDTSVQYAAADPNFGQTPNVGGIAYSNNVNGALTTTLYGIDPFPPAQIGANPILNTISPEAAGTLHTVGNLNVTDRRVAGFDISGSTGVAYAVLGHIDQTTFDFIPTLYTINLGTGQATAVGLVGVDTGTYLVDGISVAPAGGPGGGGAVPLPAAVLAAPVAAGVMSLAGRRWRREARGAGESAREG